MTAGAGAVSEPFLKDAANLPFEAQAIVETIERLLRARRADATICPSDVARELVGDSGPWREAMPQIRAVAAALERRGRLRVTRRGAEVDALAPVGPIRLGLPTET